MIDDEEPTCPGRRAADVCRSIFREVAMRRYATRHWVRAVTVAAAERTQRGVADVRLVLAVHEDDTWRTDGAP